MKTYLSIIIVALAVFTGTVTFAGNPDRVGQAGATELLINPWAKSSGWNGANCAGIIGIEAERFNPAGIIGIPNTELLFTRTTWLSGTGIYINSFGLAQKIGKEKVNAIGISVMSFDFGDIPITTVDQPEGGLGTYSPSFTNIGIVYSHSFSQRIRAGVTFRIISEAIPDAKATGVALDAGIQYITDISGKDEDRSRFGISLRNVGTPMIFNGDGLSRRGSFEGTDFPLSVNTKSATFELPTLINIGISQDFFVDGTTKNHRITFAGTFVSNSFSNDQFNLGLEYGLKNFLALRVGFMYEKDVLNKDTRLNVYNGPAAGFSVNLPFGKDRNKLFGLDYSFRATDYFGGTHSFGARLIL